MKLFAKSCIAVILSALLLCSCASKTAQQAIDQGKLAMASGDYQTALNSFKLAKGEGAKAENLDELITLIQCYVDAKTAYDADNIDGANQALARITFDYSDYTMKNDVDQLKADVAAKQSTMGDVDAQIAGTKKMVASGDYVSAQANITELYSKNLTEYQKSQVDEISATLASAQSKIDEANNKQPDVIYVQQPASNNTNVVATYYVVNCKQSITLRTSPSTSAGEITQIPLGQAVGYIENAGNGFYKINYDGKVGYSLASYLSPNKDTSSSSNNNVVATYYVVNCQQSITLRTSPSTSASEIVQIPLGQAVGYIENAGNGFYKINYDGRVGYSLASYLSPYKPSSSSSSSSASGSTAKVVNANEFITLRSSPSTSASEITKIPAGAYVTYLGPASNGFYKIQYNGMTGYGLASYLQIQ